MAFPHKTSDFRHSPLVLSGLAVSLFLASSEVQAAEVGDTIDEAVAIHLTQGGLDVLGEAVQAMLPAAFPVEAGTGEFVCNEDDDQSIEYALEEMDLQLTVDAVEITPSKGRLDIGLYTTLGSTETTLAVAGDCDPLTDLDEVCIVELPTTALSVTMGMTLSESGGGLDAEVEEVAVDMSPIGNPLSDCTLSSAIGTVLATNENAITELLLDSIEPSLTDLGPTLESALEDALGSLVVEQSFSLGAATVDLTLEPSVFEVSEAGLVIGLSALVSADELSDCVDWSAGSATTDAGWPDFTGLADGSSYPYDVGLFLGKDFLDHTLYVVWASGGLCLDASEALGTELNAGFFSSFLGDQFGELFEDTAPASLLIVPDTPPEAIFDHDGPPITIGITDMGMSLASDLDHRQLRVFRVDVDADLGIEVDLGVKELTMTLEADADEMDFRETYSDLLDPGYSSALRTLVPSMLGSVIPDDALPTLSMPSLMGVVVGDIVWLPTQDGAWQGAYLTLDTSGIEAIEVAGCGADSLGCGSKGAELDFDLEEALGCSDKDSGLGCDEGATCAASPLRSRVSMGRVVLLVGLFGLVMGRRRV